MDPPSNPPRCGPNPNMKKLTLAKETLKRLDDAVALAAAGASTGCPTLTLCQPSAYISCVVCLSKTLRNCGTTTAA